MVRFPTRMARSISIRPNQPADAPGDNWVQTTPGKGWFVYLRLYGPEAPYFDKSWIPGDAEKAQ